MNTERLKRFDFTASAIKQQSLRLLYILILLLINRDNVFFFLLVNHSHEYDILLELRKVRLRGMLKSVE